MAQVNTISDAEDEIIKRIEEVSYIINGLDNYEPFLKAVEKFRVTRENIDNNWHLIADYNKLAELRLSKMAANSIINFVPDLKNDLERLQKELFILQHPNEMVNKDYDPN